MIEALYKIGELFLGKKFGKGNTFIDFIRDGFRLGLLMFAPWVLLVCTVMIETLIKYLIGG